MEGWYWRLLLSVPAVVQQCTGVRRTIVGRVATSLHETFLEDVFLESDARMLRFSFEH